MDIRYTINRHQRATAICICTVVLLFVLISLVKSCSVGRTAIKTQASYYSDDDGKTLFADAPGRITPFDHDGKPAVMAQVLTADRGHHHWVQFLEKFSDESAAHRSAMAGTSSDGVPRLGETPAGPAMPTLLVKKPGSADWMLMSDPAAQSLMNPTTPPDGMGPGPIEIDLP